MQGEEAAKVFFAPGRLTRVGALPPTALMSLQDAGSVATLDGEAHRLRKQMFMSLMQPDWLARVTAEFEAQWRSRLPVWERAGEVRLFPEVSSIQFRAFCGWGGVPLTETETEATRRTREIRAMIDGAGSGGPRNCGGLLLRSRTEKWARHLYNPGRPHSGGGASRTRYRVSFPCIVIGMASCWMSGSRLSSS